MFAPSGKYNPCGIFNVTHLLAASICIILVIIAVIISKNIKREAFTKLLKIFAVIITILELIKIIYNLYYNYRAPINDWLPLHFCSLFIYSLWFAGFGKGKLKTIGESFLIGGGIIAGLVFLIIPSTSLKLFPIFHFQCIYSLLFHSLFLYSGLLILIKNYFTLSIKNFIYYFIFCTIFCIIAVILNIITDANFMFLDNPWGIPIPLLSKIKDFSQILYTFIIYIAYTCGTYLTTMLLQKIYLKTIKEK